jgi:hypothetical protein
VLIVMMIVRPQGLLGVREVWEVARSLRERRRSRARGFPVESRAP